MLIIEPLDLRPPVRVAALTGSARDVEPNLTVRPAPVAERLHAVTDSTDSGFHETVMKRDCSTSYKICVNLCNLWFNIGFRLQQRPSEFPGFAPNNSRQVLSLRTLWKTCRSHPQS